jgi:hypothetical protein
MQGKRRNEGLIIAYRGGILVMMSLLQRKWIDLESGIPMKIKERVFACLWGWGI